MDNLLNMEMPVPCEICGNWVELNDTRESLLYPKILLCPACYNTHAEVKDLLLKIEADQRDLDREAGPTIGRRREWKRSIKDMKEQIKELGFCADEFL